MERVTGTSWQQIRSRVVEELRSLTEHHYLILGEPVPPTTSTRRGLRGLISGGAKPAPARFVQVLRTGDHLLAECVGATSFGGTYDIDDATDGRLRSLGWKGPGDVDYESTGGPNYRVWFAAADAGPAAALLTDTLGTLGLTPGDALEIQRDS